MKSFLLFIVVTALFFYLKNMNDNSGIDTVGNEQHNGIKYQEEDSDVTQEKVGMAALEVNSQVAVALIVKDELDMVMPPENQSLVSPNELLVGGIDDIGGYYDGNARSPESESQQYNDITSIGIDASGVFTPEMVFNYINNDGSSPSMNKDGVSSEPPEGDGN